MKEHDPNGPIWVRKDLLRDFIKVQRGLALQAKEDSRSGYINTTLFDYYAGIEVALVGVLKFLGGYPEECRHQYRDRFGTPHPYCPWCGNRLLDGAVSNGQQSKT